MERRDVVRLLGTMAAIPFLPPVAEAAAALADRAHREVQGGPDAFRTFNAGQRLLVEQLCDTLLPRTDTPGALDVRVPAFVDHIVTEWASADERRRLLDGLDALASRALAAGAEFGRLDAARQAALLRSLDADRHAPGGPGHAFGRIKSLAVFGYFTSEVVQREVLKTQMFFSAFDGCAPA